MLLIDLQRGLVAQSLMGSLGVIVHLPQAVLIAPLLGIPEVLAKALGIIGAVATLDDAVAPRAGLGQ